MKSLSVKRPSKDQRELSVLLALVELYLETGKPIGSNSLKESNFEDLSSATIRNYFAKLEKEGFLKQLHCSGGRIPTHKAYRKYIEANINRPFITKEEREKIHLELKGETKEMFSLLHKATELLSDLTGYSAFLSSPRFDQDFIQNVKLVSLDKEKVLCILSTDFGWIRTEILYPPKEMTPSLLSSIEDYFLWRLSKGEKPLFSDESEIKLAQKIYNEVMVRHVIENVKKEEVYRTGLSKLLTYQELSEPSALAATLSFLENENQMQKLLHTSLQENSLLSWVGEELSTFTPSFSEPIAIISLPYYIHGTPVGSIAVLGPERLSYRSIFGIMKAFSEELSHSLTKSIYKFKISFEPSQKDQPLQQKQSLLQRKNSILLEDKSPR